MRALDLVEPASTTRGSVRSPCCRLEDHGLAGGECLFVVHAVARHGRELVAAAGEGATPGREAERAERRGCAPRPLVRPPRLVRLPTLPGARAAAHAVPAAESIVAPAAVAAVAPAATAAASGLLLSGARRPPALLRPCASGWQQSAGGW